MAPPPHSPTSSIPANSLYDESFHHAACGLGFVAQIDGRASHEIVEQGLVVLENLAHRGAAGADALTGDGAGVLVQLPHSFLHKAAKEADFDLPDPGWYGAGSCFLWTDDDMRARCEDLLSMIVAEEGQRVIGWRDVPTDNSAIGEIAKSKQPLVRQVFIERRSPDVDAFERKLYLIRRRFHRTIERAFGPDRFYIVSLSARTIVYKGMLQGTQVSGFYPELLDPTFSSALALVHSRFSTNTSESWALAHPYRYIAHNGEINTVRGNVNWMRTREAQLESELFGSDIPKLHPIIEPNVSDSAAFDNALEFLRLGGRSLPQAIMTMMPEAWERHHELDANRRAFYHYSGSLMQPWDGPAAIAFTDGKTIGAALDRNGLRPARYCRTIDGRVVLASEDGVLPIDPSEITERWRLGPGRMMVLDLEAGVLRHDGAAKQEVVAAHPYRQWVFENSVGLGDPPTKETSTSISSRVPLISLQRAYGYTSEDMRLLLTPMAKSGQEADGSMGTDTPLAILSERPRVLFDYFHQLFAQVTNPPIDPLRERMVMSLRVSLGRQDNLLSDGPHHARRIVLPSPVLTSEELQRLSHLDDPSFRPEVLSLLWPASAGTKGMDAAVTKLCAQAMHAVNDGATILVLTDRGVDEESASMPSLIAVGAVVRHLVEVGLGGQAAVVVESGEIREVHHVAALLAFGADAISPYLAFASIEELIQQGVLGEITIDKAKRNFVKAMDKGLLKVISKMGISTLHSYTDSHLFEVVGLHRDVIDRFFPRAASRLSGLQLSDIAAETLARHREAFDVVTTDAPQLSPGGEYQLRQQGAPHAWNEKTVPLLQRAVRNNSFATYEAFAKACDDESSARFNIRSLFDFHRNPISIDDVEPAVEIVKRFNTGAMSLGSISKESHETIAVALNRIGGKSNSGEGGEDENRYQTDANGDQRRSAIKQVASARFGVTANYLVNADTLQIKVAQGAKPGEGGQLPGHKVSDEIAHLRHSTPGVGLISPPPHHDIYSIEDLSQLIYDLKMVSPTSDISVKLVAEAGVGTVAAGVAKAKADHVTISGFDGGTGAAMQSSIKHAGLPWELGLAETQQVLVDNDLRGRIRVQVDGQLKTGRDVVVGALLGAEEFGFSTAPLVAIGCVMMRVCHLNTCPVGIATQDPILRERFQGRPEHVVNYFFFVAEQVRALMAELGFRTFDEMIGRVDKLKRRDNIEFWKADRLDLSAILRPHPTKGDSRATTKWVEEQHHLVDDSFDHRILPDLQHALSNGTPTELRYKVNNVDRTVGGRISGEIARRYGSDGLPDDTISLKLEGVGGQSFGAWGAKGMTLQLTGAANDYAGKGLSGAKIIVRPPEQTGYRPRSSVIVGNVALYGATSGEAYFCGIAGERFAVRNSGAVAVVEGCGDHGCEYMTGGTVVVLGHTGRNFAAGMSGGVAFLHDPYGDARERCNLDMVDVEVLSEDDKLLLQTLLERHRLATGSVKAEQLLAAWPTGASEFMKVMPHDLKKVLEAQQQADLQLDDEQVEAV